jgi:hydrogenase maturation protease
MGPALLVLGIGNPLRGDDGIGPWLVERALPRWIHRWPGPVPLPAANLRSRPQLLPELAADLAVVRRVLVVDAWRAPAGAVARIQPLPRSSARWSGSHGLQPADLLALAAGLYGQAPRGEILLIPAWWFGPPGAGHPLLFSAPLRRQVPRLRHLLLGWLQEAGASV